MLDALAHLFVALTFGAAAESVAMMLIIGFLFLGGGLLLTVITS